MIVSVLRVKNMNFTKSFGEILAALGMRYIGKVGLGLFLVFH